MIDKNVSVLFILHFSFIFAILCVNCQLNPIGSECWSQSDCRVRYTYCDNYRCACYDPLIPNQNLTLCTVGTNEVCQSTESVCYDPNARCNGTRTPRYCDCAPTFIQHTETSVCLQALNQNCTEDGLACVDGSCENGKCVCPQPLVPNSFGNRCVTGLGENCVHSQECSDPYATCESNGPCVCKDGYQQMQTADGSTLCARILGASCNNDEDCAVENSFCETMRQGTTICNCREGYVRSADTQKCLEVPLHWPGSCEEDRQCHGVFGILSSCSSFTCTCPVGHTFSENGGECILSMF